MTDAVRDTDDFEREAARRRTSFAAELWDFMRHNKKWWLTPIILILVLMAVLVVLGGSGAAPFLYPLF
ncbi:MAG TPA: DUF5989 family protein [Acidimicrobiia bacterium]|nr:DUF5989 family protein [Acidimicrobiia bacterium]HZQ78754.1 DUF5989 family protein [Acidimicrobiia bacterium]